MKWISPLFNKLTTYAVIIAITANPIFGVVIASDLSEPIIPEAEIATCKQISKTCVDGPSTKNINGVSVTRDCWQYDYQFKCTDPNAADYCDPLKQENCEVQGQECLERNDAGVCLRYNHKYSCDVDIKKQNRGTLPENIEELEPTHLITQEWETAEECKQNMEGKACTVISETCIEGPETREINGVEITRDCWKKKVQWQCNSFQENECSEMEANPECVLKEEKCVSEFQDGSCQIWDKVYECTEPERTEEVSQCVDRDFASTMTNMEMLREISRYYDINSQTFFKGDPQLCSIKLGGALDGVFGGNCCKSQGDPNDFRDWAVQAGTSMALNYGLSSLGSHYTFTLLAVNGQQMIATGIQAAEGFVSSAIPGGSNMGPSFFGFGLTTTAPTGGAALGTVGMGGNTFYITFDPMSFAIAIAIMVLQMWLACEQSDIITVLRRDAGLCVKVGSYCHKKVVGACVEKKDSFCCFISKLSKIINVEGRRQLGRGFGSPESPQCEGFTAQELEKLDFSKMNLSEFYQEIRSRMPDPNSMLDRAKNQGDKMKENYYEQ